MPRQAPNGFIPVTETYRLVVATGTSAEEYVTDITAGYERILYAARWISTGDGAGAGGSRLFRIVKNASTVAASKTMTLALTDSNGVKGLVTAFTNGTKDERIFRDSDTFTIDVTAAGTQFTTLTGQIQVVWLVKPQQIPA